MEYFILSQVCDVRDGTHESPNYVIDGFPLVTSKNIKDNELDLSNVNYICKKDFDKINLRSKVDKGDILMPMIGTIGNPYIVGNFTEFAIKNVALIKFTSLQIINKYVFFYLISSSFKQYVRDKNKGGTQKFLSLGDIREIKIPKRDLASQQHIVTILSSVEKVILKRKQQLEQFDLLIKSRFVEMFGDIDLSINKSDWIEIKDIGTVVSGATPKTIISEYWNGEFNWFTPAELSNNSGYIFESERKLSQKGVDSCSLQKLPVNTVLLTSRAPIGKLAIAGTECYCNQGFKNIICGTKVLPRYLYYLLLFNTEFLNSLGRGATFKEISKSIVENIKMPIPPIELQNKFARFVEQVEKSKTQVQKSLDEAQLLFDSLMQEYFGQKRGKKNNELREIE